MEGTKAKTFLTIAGLDFLNAVIIVACTLAYVKHNYKQTVIWEVIFVTQWFKQRNLSFDDAATRSWKFGYPAYLLGSVFGTVVGLWLGTRLGV